MFEIEKNIKEDNYFIKTADYKYVFDWNTMLELRIKFKDYAHREIDSWYEDLDMFMRRKMCYI